jgi:hypothetical protein
MEIAVQKKRDNLTYDRCKEVSLEHNTISSLRKANPSVLNKIRNKGWDELLSHMTRLSKPAGYYTYDKCKEEISGMKYLSELQGKTIHRVIRKNGWYEELTKHLIRQQSKPYTEEEVLLKVLEFKTRADFQKNCPGHYNAMKRLGITEKAYQHMGKSHKDKRYSKKEILKSSAKYKNQRDWLKAEPHVFNSAVGYSKKGGSEEDKLFWAKCIEHMGYVFKPNGYWTDEKLREEALKYKTSSEFLKNNSVAYSIIKKRGLWDELCGHIVMKMFLWSQVEDPYEYCKEVSLTFTDRGSIPKELRHVDTKIRAEKWYELYDHMPYKSSNINRHIYAFEFEDISAYIGLAYDVNKRYSDHFTGKNHQRSAVKYHHEVNGVDFKFKVLTDEPIHKDLAGQVERDTVEKYRNDGWHILNRVRAGSLGGGTVKWNYKFCKEHCSKYNSLKKFSYETGSWVISIIRRNGWWDELTAHMDNDINLPGHWNNKEVCHEESKKYGNPSGFQKGCPGAYKAMVKNGWQYEFYPEVLKLKDEYWDDYDRCKEVVKNFKTLGALKGARKLVYTSIIRNGWVDEFYPSKRDKTIDECKEYALKYDKRWDFHKNHPDIYRLIRKNNWVDEVCAHMKEPNKNYNRLYHDKEYCKEYMKQFKKASDVNKYGIKNVRKKLVKLGWWDEVTVHFEPAKRKLPGYWNNEEVCIAEGLKYRSRSEFQKKCSGAYKASKSNNWIDIIFPKK